jgi:prolyl oligopeptidase
MHSYAFAERAATVDVLHGQRVPDPYRWLEDASAPETEAWSVAQDALARSVLDASPGRRWLAHTLKDLLSTGTVFPPVARGDRLFFLRRTGDQEHPVLIVREPDGTERALIDPAALSPDATVTLDFFVPSWEGDLLAYGLSEGGNEEAVLRVMDVATGAIVDGPIDRTRYSPLVWLPGGREFFFGRRLAPDQVPAGDEMFFRRIYRHQVGTSTDHDVVVFGEGRDKTEYHSLDISRDGRWLLLEASKGTEPRNDLYLADLAGDGAFRLVHEGVDALTFGGVEDDGLLYLLTTLDAPRRRVVVTDPAMPEPAHWRELVPESETVLSGFVVSGDAVMVGGTRWAVSEVRVHDRSDGAHITDVPLPGVGMLTGLTGRPGDGDDVWIGYTDFVTPPEVHHWSVANRVLSVWETAPGGAKVKNIRTEQVWFASKDGTRVPMFLITADTGDRREARPTILSGYGGFNNAMTPNYQPNALAWAEAGGTYAVAGLRGGGEGGEEWHRAGRRERKQNVFDDFEFAARWLVAEGVAPAGQLAINGGSNGGLLVGAALTQHPELYRSVVCSAPLLDMVRYEKFGLGETWNDEYGTAEDPEEFGWLYAYSPYHHVVDGTRYPAVLFTLFESDTRVDPLHGRKMCAALQHATTASIEERPIIVRRERDVGHFARSVGRTIDLAVDVLSFQAAQLGLQLPD